MLRASPQQRTISLIDEQFVSTSLPPLDLKQIDEIEELSAMQIDLPQEFEIPMAEALLMDVEPKDVLEVQAVEKWEKQKLPQKLVLVESSSLDDRDKLPSEQTPRTVVPVADVQQQIPRTVIPVADVQQQIPRTVIPVADVQQQISLEQYSPQEERRLKRTRTSYQTDLVTEIPVQWPNTDTETRCKNFEDDLIQVPMPRHPHQLINSWILDDLLAAGPEVRNIRKPGTAFSLSDLLVQHSERSRMSLQEKSVSKADVSETRRTETLPKISFEEFLASPTTVPDLTLLAPIEPVITEPAPVEPVITEPAPVEPVITEPAHVEPVITEPAPVEPVITEPAPVEPGIAEPAPVEPGIAEPPPVEPGIAEPTPQLMSPNNIAILTEYQEEEPQVGVQKTASEEESRYDENVALAALKQSILKLWDNLGVVTFEDLSPKATTGKREIVRTLRLLGILDNAEFLYLEQASPEDPIVVSKF